MSTPVGTIIPSLLDWERFARQAGDSFPDFVPDHSHPDHNCWAPLDGRDVAGSTYAETVADPTLPDFRGMFIRGLNAFELTPHARVRDDGKQDPDARTPGDEQDNAVGPHSHTGVIRQAEHPHAGNSILSQHTESGSNRWDGTGNNENNATDIGGAAESRPNNVAVYYYLRIN